MYERSYMHRDTVTHTVVSKQQFVITASVDGHVKFWKKARLASAPCFLSGSTKRIFCLVGLTGRRFLGTRGR